MSPAPQASKAPQAGRAPQTGRAPQSAPHPTAPRPYRYGLAERLYLPLLAGMMVTLKHFVQNLFGRRRRYTIDYPEERRRYSHRYRGHHILTQRPDGSLRCVACFLCATACPAECIHIEAAEHPDVNVEKYPLVYDIDMLRCVFCGYCVDACPEEAIIMSNNHDMAYFSREQSMVTKEELTRPYTFDPSQLGYRPSYPEERAALASGVVDLVGEARRHSAAASAAEPASH